MRRGFGNPAGSVIKPVYEGAKVKSVSIDQGDLDIFAVLDEIEKTQEIVVLYRHGKPVANLSPFKRKGKSRLRPHPVMCKIVINYDPTEAMVFSR